MTKKQKFRYKGVEIIDYKNVKGVSTLYLNIIDIDDYPSLEEIDILISALFDNVKEKRAVINLNNK